MHGAPTSFHVPGVGNSICVATMGNFLDFYEQAKSQDVYVILGRQGSGTNLLARLMTAIFDFSVVQDRSLIFNAAVRVHRSPSRDVVRRELRKVHSALFPGELARRLRTGKAYFRQGKNYAGIEENLDRVDIRTAPEFAYFFYSYHAYHTGKSRLAIKSDDLWENFEFLDDVLPRRKSILLVRDCRDNVLSIMNKNFGPKDIYVGSHYVKKGLNIYAREYDARPGDCMVVKYEQILENPANVVRSLVAEFGLEPENDFEAALKRLRIRRQNSQKWRSLSSADLRICESILADELRRYGYPVQNDSKAELSSGEILRHRMNDVALRIPQKVKTLLFNVIEPD